MFVRSGRLPQLTQMIGTPAARSAGSSRLQRLDRRPVGRVVGADMIDPAALGAEIILHIDNDHRGAVEVHGNVLRLRADRRGQRFFGRHRQIDVCGSDFPRIAPVPRRANSTSRPPTMLAFAVFDISLSPP